MLDSVRPSDRARFWAKVNTAPTEKWCLEWTGATAKGYGVLMWKQNRMTQASRIAWELEHGTEPVGVIRHTCDNRPCVNVGHLIDGTQAENVIDMFERNPHCRADGAHSRGFTFAQVDEMRRLYRTGRFSQRQLAEMFDAEQTLVGHAVSGRRYRRGPTEPPVPLLSKGRLAHGLTMGQVDEMRRLYRAGGVSQKELAARFDVSPYTAHCAVTGRTYACGPSEPPVIGPGRGYRVGA